MHPTEPLGAAAAVAVFQQQRFGLFARLYQCRLEALRHGGAQLVLAPGIGRRKRLKVADDRRSIDQFDAGAVRSLNVEHGRYE